MTSHRMVDDGDLELWHGDVIDVLRQLPAGTVQTCITSPPYWGLRDYGTGEWTGGDADCEHRVGGQVQDTKAPGAIMTGQRPGVDASTCRACGARRVDSQLGLEASPAEYVERLVAVFREVRRVLRDDGTLWLNLGDSYASTQASDSRDAEARSARSTLGPKRDGLGGSNAAHVARSFEPRRLNPGLKPKDLVGIPWRVAFALQTDGWYLRSDIIWSKPNPMPESVTDRPTKAHEYLFLLSKRPRYYWDADAIREPHAVPLHAPGNRVRPEMHAGPMDRGGKSQWERDMAEMWGNPAGRNRRSVWTIATEPFPEAHFATYPQELVRPCILAGSREGDTVLDPFIGSGTTALVARKHGRRCIGIDLSAEYLAIAARRLQQLSLFADPVGRSEDTMPEEVA